MREEQHLDRDRQPGMQRQHQHQQRLALLPIRRADHRIQVPDQEQRRHPEADRHKDVVENVHAGPADQRDRNPDQVRVPVQRPALEQVRALGAEIPQREEEQDGDDEGVAVYQAGGTYPFLLAQRIFHHGTLTHPISRTDES